MSEAPPSIEVKEALMQFKASEPIQGRLLLYPAIGKNAFQTKPKVEEQQLKNAAENPVIDKKVYQDMTDLSEAERNELWMQKKEEWERQEAEKKRNDATYIEKRFNAAELWRENFKKNAVQGNNKSFIARVSALLKKQTSQATYELTNDEIQYFYSTFIYDRSTKTKLTVETFVSKMDELFGRSYATLSDEDKNSMLWLARQLFGGDVSGEMIMQLSDLHIKQKQVTTQDERKANAATLIEKSNEPSDADKEKFANVRYYLNIKDHTEPDTIPAIGKPPPPVPAVIKQRDETNLSTKAPNELAAEIIQPLNPNQPIEQQIKDQEKKADFIIQMSLSNDEKERNQAYETIGIVLETNVIETANDKALTIQSGKPPAVPLLPLDTSIQAKQLDIKADILDTVIRQNDHYVEWLTRNPRHLNTLIQLLTDNAVSYSAIGNDNSFTAQTECFRLQNRVLEALLKLGEIQPQQLAIIVFERSELKSFVKQAFNLYKNENADIHTREYSGGQIDIAYRIYEKLLEKGFRRNLIQLIRTDPKLTEGVLDVAPIIESSDSYATPLFAEIATLIDELPTSIHELSSKMGADTTKEQHITETVWQLAEDEGLTDEDIQLLLSNYQKILSAQPVSSVTDLADPALAQYLYDFEKKYFKSLNGENTAVLASRAYVLMQLYPELETSAYKLDFTAEQLKQIKVITELIRLISK